MSGRDVERELTEFFRHMGTPAPSPRLREAVVTARGGSPRIRTFASRAPGAALALLSLAATIVLAAGLLFIATNRGGPGRFGPAAGPSETPSASASESTSALPSQSESPTASAGPSESLTESPNATATVQPSATPRPSISFGPSGKFSPAGSMGAMYTIATVLSDGRVLFTGAEEGDTTSAKLYDPYTGQFSPTGRMLGPHSQGKATLLADGRVLIVGGMGSTGTLSQPELYDPRTGSFGRTGSMSAYDSFPTAVLLKNGKVLLISTTNNGQTGTTSAQLYDPGSGTFEPTGAPSAVRISPTATLLSDGRVLLAGGWDGCCVTVSMGPVASAEIYDPTTGRFSPTELMKTARAGSAATLLTDGRVLVTGGSNGSVGVASAELFDPVTGTFSLTGSMTADREHHSSTLLADGRVLIAGGMHDPGPVACAGTACIAMVGTTDLTSAEIYDPTAGKFKATGSMATPRSDPAAILLQDGRVLVAGGFTNRGFWTDAELYQP
jgi:hypothetical protein